MKSTPKRIQFDRNERCRTSSSSAISRQTVDNDDSGMFLDGEDDDESSGLELEESQHQCEERGKWLNDKPQPHKSAQKLFNKIGRRGQTTKMKQSGRIMVSIQNYAPPSTSTLLISEPIKIANLHWRLQIILTRNPVTCQARFLSLYVLLVDELPLNETLTAQIVFRLVSQEEGSIGFEQEIIGHFDNSHPYAGMSLFCEFREIFAEGSEYVCEQLGNEAQIEAKIRVKSRQTVQKVSVIEGLVHSALKMHRASMPGGQFNINSHPTNGSPNVAISARRSESGEEKEGKVTKRGEEEKEMEKEESGKNMGRMVDERQPREESMPAFDEDNEQKKSSLGGSQDDEFGAMMALDGGEEDKNGAEELTAKRECSENEEDDDEEDKGMADEQLIVRKQQHNRIGGVGKSMHAKITDYFHRKRRSCRIVPTLLDNLRLQMLKEQVKCATNEHWLEIFHTPNKGRGLRTGKPFAKNEFVVEYKGDVLNLKRAKKREKKYAQNPTIGCYMFYFKYNETAWCIDATTETAHKGRLVNHSRLAPNMKAKVFDLGDRYPHLCLVALREIKPGEELTFDYGDRTPLIVEKNPWLLNT